MMTEGDRMDRNSLIYSIIGLLLFAVLGLFVWRGLLVGSVLFALLTLQSWMDVKQNEESWRRRRGRS